jgi:hypothetical protein
LIVLLNKDPRLKTGAFFFCDYSALLVVFLVGALGGLRAQELPCASTIWKQSPPNAVVDIALNKTTIRRSEWPFATMRITNCGTFPFYVPTTIQDWDWHGGFQDIVTGPPNSKLQHSVAAEDYGPDYHPDVVQEVRESWILLMPGQFYGGTVRLNTAPGSLGIWKVVARRNPPRVSDELKQRFEKELKFPVLLEPVDSKPVYLKVVK